jgi:hypothetical protein
MFWPGTCQKHERVFDPFHWVFWVGKRKKREKRKEKERDYGN